MKCEKCKQPIPKGKEKYAKAKLLCKVCYNSEIEHPKEPSKQAMFCLELSNR